jgi:hypothetical protein
MEVAFIVIQGGLQWRPWRKALAACSARPSLIWAEWLQAWGDALPRPAGQGKERSDVLKRQHSDKG